MIFLLRFSNFHVIDLLSFWTWNIYRLYDNTNIPFFLYNQPVKYIDWFHFAISGSEDRYCSAISHQRVCSGDNSPILFFFKKCLGIFHAVTSYIIFSSHRKKVEANFESKKCKNIDEFGWYLFSYWRLL